MSKGVETNSISLFRTGIWCGGNSSIQMSTGAKITECFWFIIRSCLRDNYRVINQIGDNHFSIVSITNGDRLNIHFGYKYLAVFASFLIVPLLVLVMAKVYFRHKNRFEPILPVSPMSTAPQSRVEPFPTKEVPVAVLLLPPKNELPNLMPQPILSTAEVSHADLSKSRLPIPKTVSLPIIPVSEESEKQTLEPHTENPTPLPDALEPIARNTAEVSHEDQSELVFPLPEESSSSLEPSAEQELERQLTSGFKLVLPPKTFEKRTEVIRSDRLSKYIVVEPVEIEGCPAAEAYWNLYELLASESVPNLDEMEALLQVIGPVWINKASNRRRPATPLGRAVLSGHLEAVKKLVEFGARETVDPLDDVPEETLLFLAAEGGNFPVFTYLLQEGANSTLYGEGKSPLPRTLVTILKNRSLMWVKKLFAYTPESEHEKLANGNLLPEHGSHPLVEAFHRDDAGAFEYLLYKGAVIPPSGAWALTPIRSDMEIMMLTRMIGREVEQVVRAAAESTVPIEDLFFSAIREKKYGIVVFLLKHGVPIDTQRNGRTALEYAVADGFQYDVMFLLRLGADPQMLLETTPTQIATEAIKDIKQQFNQEIVKKLEEATLLPTVLQVLIAEYLTGVGKAQRAAFSEG